MNENDIKVILDDGEISYGQLTVGTVTTGEAGTEATVTNKGTSSRAILDFTIPRGEKGEKGDTGSQGIQGVAGKDGTNGIDGKNGVDGKTPEKGKDYFTAQEIEEITNEVIRVVISEVGSGVIEGNCNIWDLSSGVYSVRDGVTLNTFNEAGTTESYDCYGGLLLVSNDNDAFFKWEYLEQKSSVLYKYYGYLGYFAEVNMGAGKTYKYDISKLATTDYVDEKLGDVESLLSEV